MSKKKNRSGRRWPWALGSFLTYWLWRRWRSGGGRSEGAAVRHESVERGHEPEDRETNVPVVAILAIGLLLGVVIILWIITGFFNVLDGRMQDEEAGPSPFATYDQIPPEPRLQPYPGVSPATPPVDLQKLHTRENERLYGYGRVARSGGAVYIPIRRAMELIAERGLPARDTSARADTTAGQRRADSVLVPTESGFRTVQTGLSRPESPPYLGSSPEPYTPAPEFRRFLTEEGYLQRPDSTY